MIVDDLNFNKLSFISWCFIFKTYYSNIFCRALSLSNVREDVNIKNIFAHPISPIPLSLFYEDSTMRKTCKSDLMHFFKEVVAHIFCLRDFDLFRTVIIRHDLGLIQGMGSKLLKTVGNLASSFVWSLCTC